MVGIPSHLDCREGKNEEKKDKEKKSTKDKRNNVSLLSCGRRE